MTNSRHKGKKAEEDVRQILRDAFNLNFELVPGSGCGSIKGDLHIPGKVNKFCIEIKHYAESAFNDKIFTNKTNNFTIWWNKLIVQSNLRKLLPLLIFKYNRSKWFISTNIKPVNTNKFIDINWLNCYTLTLDEWLSKESITWLAS